jgi:hypothetical protein
MIPVESWEARPIVYAPQPSQPLQHILMCGTCGERIVDEFGDCALELCEGPQLPHLPTSFTQ